MGVIKELKERIRRLSSTPELEETKEKLERAVNHDGLREILEEELDIHRSHNKNASFTSKLSFTRFTAM